MMTIPATGKLSSTFSSGNLTVFLTLMMAMMASFPAEAAAPEAACLLQTKNQRSSVRTTTGQDLDLLEESGRASAAIADSGKEAPPAEKTDAEPAPATFKPGTEAPAGSGPDAAATPAGGSSNATEDADEWSEEDDMETCCEYTRMSGKRLKGRNLAKPKESLVEAQELCDMTPKCQGVVALGRDAAIPEGFRGKFVLRGGDDLASGGGEGTVLYKKGAECPKKKDCMRGEEAALPEESQNATNATNGTNATNATLSLSGCVTRKDPRVDAWLETTAPPGTPCVFGVDARDEGRHCILDDLQYGSFGWCHTKADMSQWGSCSEGCPLSGQHKVLGQKVDEVSDLMHEMHEFLHEKLGDPAPPSLNNTNGTNGTTAAFMQVTNMSE